jgi:hypothetical protein
MVEHPSTKAVQGHAGGHVLLDNDDVVVLKAARDLDTRF